VGSNSKAKQQPQCQQSQSPCRMVSAQYQHDGTGASRRRARRWHDVQNVLNSQFICKFILSPALAAGWKPNRVDVWLQQQQRILGGQSPPSSLRNPQSHFNHPTRLEVSRTVVWRSRGFVTLLLVTVHFIACFCPVLDN